MNHLTNPPTSPASETRRARLFAALLVAALGVLAFPQAADAQIKRPPRPGGDPPDPIPAPSRPMVSQNLPDDGSKTFTATGIQLPMLSSILPAYEELIGKKIIVDSTITDAVTMTVNTMQKMTREEAIRFYEDTFLINGFAVIGVDESTVKFINVASKSEEGTGKIVIYSEGDQIPDTDDKIAYIMKFNNISAEEASRTLQLYTRSTTGGYIPAPDGLTLIITESGRVIRTLIDLKEKIDVEKGNLRQEAIQLLRADAEEVAAALNEILTAATSQRQRSGEGQVARRPQRRLQPTWPLQTQASSSRPPKMARSALSQMPTASTSTRSPAPTACS